LSVDESDRVFAGAAELFALLSTPIRLRLISALCHDEKNVSQLLSEIDATQPNLSQHLGTLYRAGILGKRREGAQIFYRLQSQRAASLCRAVCTQIATEIDSDLQVDPQERLLPFARQV
jgi:DNA-binding transcriptional ArsR family regulator